ncbi:MAG: DUF4367 domain-containing protein [Oscillospiraceae bacterium]|nr:DUF4367 domain-containing protein [Oscillospiraceae bacterium]
MNKAKLNRELFETMLKEAVCETFENELQSLPAEQELEQICELSPSTKQKIQHIIRAERRHAVCRKMRAVSKRVAILLAIVVPVSFGSLLSVEASRNAIFNAIIEWKDDRARISYQQGSSDFSEAADRSARTNAVYAPSYLPDGFTALKKKQVGHMLVVTYRDKNGKDIIFQQSLLSDGGHNVIDSEHSTYSQININGEQASLFRANTNEDSSLLLWENQKFSFLLMSKIDPKELIKIAESVKTQ